MKHNGSPFPKIKFHLRGTAYVPQNDLTRWVEMYYILGDQCGEACTVPGPKDWDFYADIKAAQ